MCGIVGIFDPSGRSSMISEEILEGMTRAIVHRGPDDDGLFIDNSGKVGLGFRRLSILDLSYAGHQPMATEDGDIVLTFNGEVYNHQEIRDGLEKRGYRYRSQTDTESLLYAYREYGPSFVDRLIGMFAIAIWDRRKQQVLLFRDRLGVKPLYFTTQGGCTVWGSEIKSILRHPVVSRSIDQQGLADYFSFFITPPTSTLFTGIEKLEAGHRATIDSSGTISIERYWDVDHVSTPFRSKDLESEEFCVETLRAMLRDSIRLRMISDVPFGVLLSGGVDSSLNVALMSEIMDRPVETFSAGFKDLDDHNELDYARLVADKFGTNHVERLVGVDDVVDNLARMVWHQDEPNADPACVPMFFVSRAARESGTVVVQVGEGADETFAGYSHYRSELKYHRYYYRIPRPLHSLLYPAVTTLNRNPIVRDYARRALTRSTPVFYGAIPALSGAAKEELIGRAIDHLQSADRISQRFLARLADLDFGDGRNHSHLRKLTYVDMKTRLAELLLMRVDKMAMASSIEARVPFLDHRIVEFSYRVPDSLKIRNGIGKYLLKKAAEGIIPNEIIYRRKQGLNSPIVEWLRSGRLADYARETILDSAVVDPGASLLDRTTVERWIESHRSGRENQAKPIWAVLVFALWHAEFIENGDG